MGSSDGLDSKANSEVKLSFMLKAPAGGSTVMTMPTENRSPSICALFLNGLPN